MKTIKKYSKLLLTLLVFTILVVRCMSIEEIIHPEDAKVDSDINISVKFKIVAETDGNSKVAFGILVPKSWNAAQNAELSLTTTGAFAGNVVTNEPMILMDASEKNPSDALPWASSFQSKFGLMENTGPMEWVVFKSSTTFTIHDKDDGTKKEVNATMNIKIRTGKQAIRCFMGYTFCGEKFGFDGQKFKDASESKVLEVTGGDLPMQDFTVEPPISFVPATFGFGDIFSIKYNESKSITGGLKGSEVYLTGKVLYEDNGVEKEAVMDETSDKTLMEDLGEQGDVYSYQKYIYPKDYFNLPKTATILEMKVEFCNKDKSIVILDNTGEGFVVEETCTVENESGE